MTCGPRNTRGTVTIFIVSSQQTFEFAVCCTTKGRLSSMMKATFFALLSGAVFHGYPAITFAVWHDVSYAGERQVGCGNP